MPFTQQVKDLIYNARNDGYVCTVATIGPDGPNISPKGSMMIYDDDHLAYWERSKKKALENMKFDPRVVVCYSNTKLQWEGKIKGGFLRFYGTVEFHEDGPIKEDVFKRLNEYEQNHAGADEGMAVLIKIDRAVNQMGDSLR